MTPATRERPRRVTARHEPPVPSRVRQGTHVLPTFTLESGVVLRDVSLRWTLIGTPHERHANVVLVTHALTGTADVHDWWAPLVGDGRALDTSSHAVLCVNVLGGCAGSTGPRTGDAAAFPAITTRDQAAAIWALLDAFRVRHLALVTGGSLGGMVALEVTALRPAQVFQTVVFAAPATQTALGAGWNALMRTAIAVGGARDGLALARMAGMLSYRSAEGFEQRFGATRGPDGAPAIAGWLSHHGQRLLERFDAASYVTLLDAMDRHDVARGRGSLQRALAGVGHRIVGVGIPGDLLYPAEAVQAWTRQVGARYVSLDSPHGHDAFLLEVPQVEAILRDALHTSLARRANSAPQPVRIALAGCGVVGDAFASAIAREARSVALLDRVLVRDIARERAGLAAATAQRRAVHGALTTDADQLLAGNTSVLVEALGGVEPARTLAERALERGVRVVTANKELVAAHGPALLALARAHGTTFDFEGTVSASVPVVRLLRSVSGEAPVSSITGILNGTTNYVLDAIADGTRFADAVRLAQAAGFAEADPSRDLDGRDIEAKARILAWLGFGVAPDAVVVERRGLDAAVARYAAIAARAGDRVRLLVTIERHETQVHARIGPVRVPLASAWGAVRGVQNRIVIEGAAGARWELEGPGAGGEATARALLCDLRAPTIGTHPIDRTARAITPCAARAG
jgi:homoserine O-acetyltransferase